MLVKMVRKYDFYSMHSHVCVPTTPTIHHFHFACFVALEKKVGAGIIVALVVKVINWGLKIHELFKTIIIIYGKILDNSL